MYSISFSIVPHLHVRYTFNAVNAGDVMRLDGEMEFSPDSFVYYVLNLPGEDTVESGDGIGIDAESGDGADDEDDDDADVNWNPYEVRMCGMQRVVFACVCIHKCGCMWGFV